VVVDGLLGDVEPGRDVGVAQAGPSSPRTSNSRAVSPAGLARVARGRRGSRLTPSSCRRPATASAAGRAPSRSSWSRAASRSASATPSASAIARSYGQPSRRHASAAARQFPGDLQGPGPRRHRREAGCIERTGAPLPEAELADRPRVTEPDGERVGVGVGPAPPRPGAPAPRRSRGRCPAADQAAAGCAARRRRPTGRGRRRRAARRRRAPTRSCRCPPRRRAAPCSPGRCGRPPASSPATRGTPPVPAAPWGDGTSREIARPRSGRPQRRDHLARQAFGLLALAGPERDQAERGEAQLQEAEEPLGHGGGRADHGRRRGPGNPKGVPR
jgi:hypothetical protein